MKNTQYTIFNSVLWSSWKYKEQDIAIVLFKIRHNFSCMWFNWKGRLAIFRKVCLKVCFVSARWLKFRLSHIAYGQITVAYKMAEVIHYLCWLMDMKFKKRSLLANIQIAERCKLDSLSYWRILMSLYLNRIRIIMRRECRVHEVLQWQDDCCNNTWPCTQYCPSSTSQNIYWPNICH